VAVAPPGNHLLVHDGTLALSQGARENGVRPAIDPLFRSAARSAGPDVVSVLLSGTLDDGAAGTAIVRAGGGVTIVQDPAEADFPDMPRKAIATGEVAAVLPVAAIAPAIRAAVETMAQRPAGDGGNNHNDGGPADNPGPEAATAADTPAGDPQGDPVDRGVHGPAPDLKGEPSPYSCPACGGVLYERMPPAQYLCRLGHRYSPESLRAGQEEVIEDALWTALRTLEEAASLAMRVRDRAAARGDRGMELRFEARLQGAQERADRIRAVFEGEKIEDDEAVAAAVEDADGQRTA
jgi:two-component system chemotaxis response regulator CheB